jgi:hypothetical protein
VIDELRKLLRPHAERLVDAIVERVVSEYSGVTDRAIELAREALQLELEDLHARREPDRETARPSRSPRRKPARRKVPAAARAKKSTKRTAHGRGGAARRRDRGGADESARPEPVEAAQPGARRPCGCAPRGRHARTCTLQPAPPAKHPAPEIARDVEDLAKPVTKPVPPIARVDSLPPPVKLPSVSASTVRTKPDRYALLEQQAAARRRAAELD